MSKIDAAILDVAVRTNAQAEHAKFVQGFLHETAMMVVRFLDALAAGSVPYALPEEWGGAQETLEGALDCVCRRVSATACAQMCYIKDLTDALKEETRYLVAYGNAAHMRCDAEGEAGPAEGRLVAR